MKSSLQLISILCFSVLNVSIIDAQSYKHPGLLNTKEELDFIKSKVNANTQPWKGGWDAMMVSKDIWRTGGTVASLSYSYKAYETIIANKDAVGEDGSRNQSLHDFASAYSHALQWYIKGNQANADKAIAILNAWSYKLKTIEGYDSPLHAAWLTSAVWAAEILRHTNSGWKSADIAQFTSMLDNIIWPKIKNGSGNNSNWECSMITTMIAIAIFEDDKAKMDVGIAKFKTRLPVAFKGDGKGQETCRDLAHMAMGLNALVTAAEQAWHQGIDLYSLESNRLLVASEYHAKLMLGKIPPPCTLKEQFRVPTYEMVMNHYVNRKGIAMPFSEELVVKNPSWLDTEARRAEKYKLFFGWGTLTHHDLPTGGTPPPSNQNPVASITSPANNAAFLQGETVVFKINATDLDGTISKVELYNGATKIGENNTSPYEISWTNVQTGSYSITAKATDNGNATGISSAISIVVNNPNSTTQNIALNKPVTSDSQLSSTYPASNAVDGNNSDNASRWISANTVWPHWLEVDLQGTYEIEQIKFWVGYNGYTNGIGYNFEYWNGTAWVKIIDKPTNTNAIVNETFTKVTTTKVRLNGLSGSDNILRLYEIEVYGTPVSSNILPTVAITSPASGASFNIGSTISITANASDSDGSISKVEFYSGSQLLGEDNTTTYTFNWSNFLAGSYTLYAKAYDNAGGTKTSAGVSVTINENTVVTPNLALLKPVTASAEPESQNPAENVVDGNSSSNWTAQNYPQYIEVDLLDVFDVNKIEIMPYNNRAYQFKVEGKYDTASSFQTLIDATANTEGGMVISKSFSKQPVQYVRLTITGCTGSSCSSKNWINLSEFMVYGDTIPELPTGQKRISNATLAIYPNPCNDKLNVTINNTEKNNYCIKNLNGLSVAEGRLKDGSIDVSSLKKGFYFLIMDGSIVKFIKQ